MRTRSLSLSWCARIMGLFLVCSSLTMAASRRSSDERLTSRDFFSRYQEVDLISDVPGLAAHLDENLVNAWGIAHSAGSPWWIDAADAGLSLVKNGAGEPFPPASPLVVSIPGVAGPGAPTGLIFNGSSSFQLNGSPAAFLFASEDGTISAWNGTAGTTAVIVVTTPGASYKGLASASVAGNNYLYAANFAAGTIDVFDTDFDPVDLGAGAFTDEQLPEGYSPFNVMNINGTLYVTFALHEEGSDEETAGRGLGYVDAFSPSGDLIMRLQHGPWMDAPWGVALAPGDFGKFSNDLLVGMFGSGQIAAFDPETGLFKGVLKGEHGTLVIDGLWGIGFGNDGNAGPSTTLFFAAGIEDEAHGLFGAITPIAKKHAPEE